MDRLLPPFAVALHSSGRGGGKGIGNEGVKLSMEERRGGGKVLFQFFTFASHYPNLFKLKIN